MKNWLVLAGTMACCLVAAVSPASAKTLEQIVNDGTLNVGVNLDAPPYGFIDDKQVPQGFDVDVANMLGRYLGVKVNIVQTQGPTRIPLLLTNKIDIIVADLGITSARAKQVMFSKPYGTIDGYIIASKAKKIAGVADLKGLRIGVPRASTFDTAVTKLVGDTAEVVRFDDDATTFQALFSGQVDAVGENESSFQHLMKLKPGMDLENKIMIGHQLDGVGVPPGEFGLLQWLDTAIFLSASNGELEAITQKWLDEPLSPAIKVPQ
jgi:polar amino acid transport system substrate-binding protein